MRLSDDVDHGAIANQVEELSTAYQGELQLAPHRGTWLLRTTRGRPVAIVYNETDARFIASAPATVKALVERIKRLLQDRWLAKSTYNREYELRRSLDTIRDELEAAESLGFATKDGQRRVRSALAEARKRRPS